MKFKEVSVYIYPNGTFSKAFGIAYYDHDDYDSIAAL